MINYLINSTLCSGLLLLVYKFFLEHEKMHRFNRFYLLGSVIFSLIIPFISFELPENSSPILQQTFNNSVSQITDIKAFDTKFIIDKNSENSIDYSRIIFGIYVLISLIFLARFTISLFKIYIKIVQSPQQKYSNSKLILIEEKLVAHSFLSYIFLNKLEFENGETEPEILLHEYTHVCQNHSYDILFIELIMSILWMNPFVYFYKKAIQLNHEFLADEAVIQSDFDIKSYQFLLLKKATNMQGLLLTSNFNFSTTKTRLIMITKVASKSIIRAKQLAIIPIIALAISLFGKNIVAQIPTVSSTVNTKAEKNKLEFQKKAVPFTIEGVSQAELDDFHKSILKYVRISKNGKYRNLDQLPQTELNRLEIIYKKMSKVQQDNQDFRFYPPFMPFEKNVPRLVDMMNYKDFREYGVWIDGKKVNNNVLYNYKNTDFSHYYISKLYGKARTSVSYKFQIDLMTHKYYQKYYNQALAKTENHLSWNHQKPFSEKKL